MAQIKRSTLSEQILKAVLNMIKTKGYKVGDKLPTEKEISENLGVSRNSLREVMKSLAISGIIESVAGKGTFLLKEADSIQSENIQDAVSEASTLEILQARMIIETEAAVLAAQNGAYGSANWNSFEKALLKLEDAFDKRDEKTSEDNFQFHLELVKLCKNRFLYKMHHSIIKDIHNSRKIISIDFENAEFEKKVHRKIYDAIKSGDCAMARKAMQEHFENTINYCKSLYK